MPNITYPNQRIVKVHRESAKSDFLGIKNANWKAASHNLHPHALLLYLYLASNADNYTLALSPAAVREEIGMARSTYHDQFHILIDKGYLVPAHGNTFDFYETPQPRPENQEKNDLSEDGYDFETNPSDDIIVVRNEHNITAENIEINNTTNDINKAAINISENSKSENEIKAPQIKEITIPRPTTKSNNSPRQKEPQQRTAFDF